MKSQVMIAGVLVAGLAGLAGGATSAEGIVPFDVQVPLVLKALTYDRNLKARAGDHVRIGVVSPAKASREPADDLLSSVSHLPDRTVSGLPYAQCPGPMPNAWSSRFGDLQRRNSLKTQ